MHTRFIPPDDRRFAMEKLWELLWSLPARQYRVEIKEHRNTRSSQQNRYLWGCVYPTILERGGEQLGGWTKDDLHEFFLGEWSGWFELEGFGRTHSCPIHRSSTLSTKEFEEYVDFIKVRCAEFGIVIPDPNEDATW